MAEGQGFEPWNPFVGVTRFRVARLRPLGHPSVMRIVAECYGERVPDQNRETRLANDR